MDILGDLSEVPAGESCDKSGYKSLEKQLAALDGSVFNSPALREQLLANAIDEDNISAIFTPSHHSQEDNATWNLENEASLSKTPTKRLQKSLISFTPLPGTPEKAVEEICQAVVKDKVALVAFPSLMPEVSNEDSDRELSKKVQDVSKKLYGRVVEEQTAAAGLKGDCSAPLNAQTDVKTNSVDEGDEDDDDDDLYCTLSFSQTLDLFSQNLEENSNKRGRESEVDENYDRRKTPKLNNDDVTQKKLEDNLDANFDFE